MSKLIFFFTLLFLVVSLNVNAQESQVADNDQVEFNSAFNSSSSKNALFFYLEQFKPNLESVHALPGSKINFCLSLEESNPNIEKVLPYLQKIELELISPDGQITLFASSELEYPYLKTKMMQVEDKVYSCFVGKINVPKKIVAGKYQLSELDLILTKNRRLSYREEIFESSHLPVLEIEVPTISEKETGFDKISSISKEMKALHTWGSIARGSIYFRVKVKNPDKLLKPETFKFFAKVYFDSTWVDIIQAKCNPAHKSVFFDCKLYVSRAVPILEGRNVFVYPDSMSIYDVLGNVYEVNSTKQFTELAEDKPLHWVLYYKLPVQTPNLEEGATYPSVESTAASITESNFQE